MNKTLVYEYEFDITTREGCLDATDAIKAISDHTIRTIWQFGKPTLNISLSSDGDKLVVRSDEEMYI